MNQSLPERTKTPKAKLTDFLGVGASSICAIHCLCTPLVILWIPTLGNFLEARNFHIVIASSVTALGLISCVSGYRRHKNPRIFAAILSGMSIVLICTFVLQGRMSEFAEAFCLCIGGALLIGGHLASLRSQSCC